MTLFDFEILRRYFTRSKRAYQLTFKGPMAETVLADLARFCRANTTTFHADARANAHLEGRREVWLRIQNHLHLSFEEVHRIQKLGEMDAERIDE